MFRDWERARFEGPRPRAQSSERAVKFLEYDSDANATSPNDAAFFSHAAIDEFETVRDLPQAVDLEAGAAGRVVDDPGSEDGRLRAGDDLARSGHLTGRHNSLIQSRMRHLLLECVIS